jgi:hypothetical protein
VPIPQLKIKVGGFESDDRLVSLQICVENYVGLGSEYTTGDCLLDLETIVVPAGDRTVPAAENVRFLIMRELERVSIGSGPCLILIPEARKKRTNLPPERGENDELCAITTGKKHEGTHGQNGGR